MYDILFTYYNIVFIQDIFVRDCVVIKSNPDSDEKPYVAKIGSIWQEAGNLYHYYNHSISLLHLGNRARYCRIKCVLYAA